MCLWWFVIESWGSWDEKWNEDWKREKEMRIDLKINKVWKIDKIDKWYGRIMRYDQPS